MKTDRIVAASVVLAALLFGSLVAVAKQASEANQDNQTSQDLQTNRSANSQSGTAGTNTGSAASSRDLSKLDDKTTGGTIRVSELLGADIKNSNNENVGEIKDLVIDSRGKVRYAAVTYGGFLGVGSKLFAVPFEAFKVRQDPDDPNDHDDYELTLDINKQQLDGAQGFDNEHWPNFGDTKFTQELDRRYKVSRSSSSQTQPQPVRQFRWCRI